MRSSTYFRQLIYNGILAIRFCRYCLLLPLTPLLRIVFYLISRKLFDIEILEGKLEKPNRQGYYITVFNPRFYAKALASGGLGIGEAYVDKWWECGDLRGLLSLITRNPRFSVLGKLYTLWFWEVPIIWNFCTPMSKKEGIKHADLHYDLRKTA